MKKTEEKKIEKNTLDYFLSFQKELLFALRQLGEKLTAEQETFLSEDQVDRGLHFERISETSDNASTVLKWAKQSGNLG